MSMACVTIKGQVDDLCLGCCLKPHLSVLLSWTCPSLLAGLLAPPLAGCPGEQACTSRPDGVGVGEL